MRLRAKSLDRVYQKAEAEVKEDDARRRRAEKAVEKAAEKAGRAGVAQAKQTKQAWGEDDDASDAGGLSGVGLGW